MSNAARARIVAALGRFAPGLPSLVRYDYRADFRHDLVAGLSVAAVAVPTGVANAQLAGFDAVTGLWASILPPIAYALFGTSRQLVVGPDTATSAMVAAALLPLAAGDPALYGSLSVALALLTGLFCIGASFLRLGALADFLSRPILIGFINGVAISVLLAQIGRLFGIPLEAEGVVPRTLEFLTRLPQTHLPTLAVGLATFGVMLAGRRFLFALPAALVAMVAAGAAVALFALEQRGIALLGAIQSGLPAWRLPEFPLALLPSLVADAAGLALVLFASGVLSGRVFSEKNRYEIDTDREFAAFGAANLASAAVQGFCVTGSTSRTAMADAAGGRTQVAGIVSAAGVLVAVLFLADLLRFVPVAALSAILIYASFTMFDVATLRWIWRVDRSEVVLAVITTLGVVAVGPINAILLAVALALVRFVKITSRPRDEVLGAVTGLAGLHAIDRHPGARTWRGILIYRFDGPVTFFNASYFRQRVRRAVAEAGPGLEWVVLDMGPISHIDITGIEALRGLRTELEQAGVRMVFGGRRAEIVRWLRDAGLYAEWQEELLYPTLREALRACRQRSRARAAEENAATGSVPAA